MKLFRWICILICVLCVSGGLLLQFWKPEEQPPEVFVDAKRPVVQVVKPAEPQIPEALTPFLTEDSTVTAMEPMVCDAGEIYRYSVTLPRGRARAWIFPGGAVFWCEESTRAFSLYLEGFSGDLTRLNKDEGRAPRMSHSAEGSLLIQPPLAREGRSLTGSNYVSVEEENGLVLWNNGTVAVHFNGETADWWAYMAPSDLGQREVPVWLNRCTVDKFGDQNRLTLDGYYYKTPSDYVPTGDEWYYRLPAAYIASKLARTGGSTHAYQMAVAMLDLQREHYNELGYIPTLPMSRWLSSDYDVASGFYDTRFNTDVAHAYLELGRTLGIQEYVDVAMNYAAFLVTHAGTRSTETANGGVLVDDYSHPNGTERTHSSLNHQLAEALFLYETDVTAAKAMADRMLQGITDTAEQWIKEDGNLHYAYYPDGTYGGADYPFLTYNDLLALNRHLGGNEALERLMATKKAWMDKNGITEYDK